MKLIQKKCKNCEYQVTSQDGGVTWIHGIIADGRLWLIPINSLCLNPQGQIDG